MATFFTHTNLDPALADGLEYLDFKGVLLLGLLSTIDYDDSNDIENNNQRDSAF